MIFYLFWRAPFHGYTITRSFLFVKFKESNSTIEKFNIEAAYFYGKSYVTSNEISPASAGAMLSGGR